MKKILWLTNIPSPYRVDFFNELGKQTDLTVLFEKASSDERDDDWKNYSFNTFKGVILKGFAVAVNKAVSFQFIKYINQYKESIIVVGNPATPTGVLAILYMQLRGITYIVESDGAFPKEAKGIKGRFKKRLYSKAKYCFATSETDIQYFENYGVNRGNIFKYPFTSIKNDYIIEHPLTIGEKKVIRKYLGIEESKVILSVGQFIHRKGFDVLFEAATQLPKDIYFYIVGNKPTEDYLNYCKVHQLNNIHFVDFMKPSQLKQWYLAADMFVLPTREDIWGLVINEAMACGLPVITTKGCVAGLEMVKNGVNGYLVDVDSSIQMVDAITSTYNRSNNYSCGEESIIVAKNYSIESMATRHLELFSALFES